MRVPFRHIDAFTREPFRGNPAGVCLLDAWPDDAVLRDVAREMNLSETAFAVPDGDAWRLRWFTPETEVPLCGHATLATAHALFECHDVPELRFETASGTLTVRRDGDRYELDLPAQPARPCTAPTSLAGALGIVPRLCLGNERSNVAVLENAQQVRDLRPDEKVVRRLLLPYLIATAPGDDCDFVSRFFAPAVGVPEDPVTGAAHCVLVPYWAERLGRTQLHARQLSARGGELWCTAKGDRVLLAGYAVTIVEGWLHLPG